MRDCAYVAVYPMAHCARVRIRIMRHLARKYAIRIDVPTCCPVLNWKYLPKKRKKIIANMLAYRGQLQLDLRRNAGLFGCKLLKTQGFACGSEASVAS